MNDPIASDTVVRDPVFVWSARHTVALLALCLAQLLDAVDVTVVNVALPTIRSDLRFTDASLPWVVNAYAVVFGGFMLLGGRAGDLLGKRRVLMTGISLFTAASLASGLAGSPALLIATRAAQGLAAALIAPATIAIIASMFPEGRPRNRALGVWGATTGVSSTLGVAAGGLLVGGPGWRWIFYVNIPVGLFLLLVAPRCLANDRPAGPRPRFDALGAVTVTAGVALLAYALVQTNTHAWGSQRTILLLIAAAAVLVYFVVHETVIEKRPLIPFSIFANRSVLGANVVAAIIGGGMLSLFYLISLYEQEVLHYSALKTGLSYLPLTIALVAFAGVGPLLLRKMTIGALLALGSCVAAAGLLLLAGDSPTAGLFRNVIGPSLVLAPGLALTFIPVTMQRSPGSGRLRRASPLAW